MWQLPDRLDASPVDVSRVPSPKKAAGSSDLNTHPLDLSTASRESIETPKYEMGNSKDS